MESRLRLAQRPSAAAANCRTIDGPRGQADLPVSFSTEGLGGVERRLRQGDAALAICLLLPAPTEDIVALPLLRMKLASVVAPDHPLALVGRPATRADLEPHVQLVLSDPVNTAGPAYGLASARLWRFVDLQRRLDMLLAGFGWRRMPGHLISRHLSDGRLVQLSLSEDLAIYAAGMRDRPLGRAGRWFLDDLKARLVD
jgi:DNA-binding transcriptional LysR family regulator